MHISNNKILERSYKHIVLWDFKEILLMHQILGHYLCSIGLIKLARAWRSLAFFVAVVVCFKDIFNKYFK
jgi:hypothetical protein